jgi:polyhydroxyalkanoate synthesis regulator phasin
MTVEELRAELESLVSNLTAAGFNNIDAGLLGKMDKFVLAAGEMKMNEGKRLIENLLSAMKAIQEGKSNADSGNLRLTALDFYLKKHSEDGLVEDL